MSVAARVRRPRAPPFLDPHGCGRHRPERTLLYQLVEQHFPAFRELRAEVGRPLPALVQEEFAAKPPAEQRRLMAGMQRRAAEGVGHPCLVYPMINAALFGSDAGHAIHELTEILNSKPVIEFARAISGKPGINKLDAHASCFLPGHYLNSHVDDGEINERQVAYTIGFTRGWKPDWGRMPLVWDEHDDVRFGRCRSFNTMTVFDGRISRSVSAIAPFAPKARYTVAGWFRDDPPVGKSVA